jgi:hypothetical protein
MTCTGAVHISHISVSVLAAQTRRRLHGPVSRNVTRTQPGVKSRRVGEYAPTRRSLQRAAPSARKPLAVALPPQQGVCSEPVQRLNKRLEREAEFVVVEVLIDPLCWLWPYLDLGQRGAEVALSRGPVVDASVWLGHFSSA